MPQLFSWYSIVILEVKTKSCEENGTKHIVD